MGCRDGTWGWKIRVDGGSRGWDLGMEDVKGR